MKKEKLTVASKAAEEVIKTPRASTTREAESILLNGKNHHL